jgi:hypothetical protein
MNRERNRLSWHGAVALLLLALCSTPQALPAQTPCYDFGSVPVAASCEPCPAALGCAGAPQWPLWHLLTPAHRQPAPHAGFGPGDAAARQRLLVEYRCTPFLLLPVVPVRVRTMGYVIDQPEIPCAPPAGG